MQSPIPDPFAPPAKPAPLEKGPRPDSLLWIIGASWLLNLAGTLAGERTDIPTVFMAAVYVFSAFVDYSLWIGRNWARIMIFIFGILSLLGTFSIDRGKPLSVIIQVAAALFYLWYMYYLTRPPVVEFFKGKDAV